MSAINQIQANSVVLIKLMLQGKFSKAKFVSAGLIRGIQQLF